MKTEHEKLKEIVDLIEYKGSLDKVMGSYDFIWGEGLPKTKNLIAKKDVREIIFNPEFMDKYMKYVEDKGIVAPSKYKVFLIDLHKNLDDPVDYLYNLLPNE